MVVKDMFAYIIANTLVPLTQEEASNAIFSKEPLRAKKEEATMPSSAEGCYSKRPSHPRV